PRAGLVVVDGLRRGLVRALTRDVVCGDVEQVCSAEGVAHPALQTPAGMRVPREQAGSGVRDVQVLGLLGPETGGDGREHPDGRTVAEHRDQILGVMRPGDALERALVAAEELVAVA